MKALMWTAPKEMEITEIDTPTPPAGEVLIRVDTVGICGSDLEGYLGHNSLRVPPLLMGHEAAGVIDAVGEGVTRFKTGDRVVFNPLIHCGTCPRCRRGLANLCDHRQIIGIHRPGAYAEYVAVPESNVLPVADGVSLQRASLAEPLACALRAARRAMEDVSFAHVVVIGAGPIGILSAFVAEILGASTVSVLDVNPNRLALIEKLGFDGVFNSADGEKVKEQIAGVTRGEGADVIIDAAGFQPTRSLAMELVNNGGTIMNIGLGIDDTQLPINVQIRSEINIKGSFCYTAQDFADALRLLEDGRVTEDGWSITRPLTEGGESFAELVSGQTGYGKIFLQP